MRYAALLATLLLIGGCVSGSGAGSSLTAEASAKPDSDQAERPEKPRDRCEDTSIAGAPRTVCY